MNKDKAPFVLILEHVLTWLVLLILLFYTYVHFFEHPYQGFRADSSGRITGIYMDVIAEQSLHLDDQLIEVNGLSWVDFRADLRRPLYGQIQPGQVIILKIERDQQPKVIAWVFPGPTLSEILNLAFYEGWLAYIFWFFGALTLFFTRPKDELWRLMIAFNFLTAILIITGGVSFYHLRESAILLHIIVWLCVPVYLHLNWVLLKPLSKLPAPLVWGTYNIAIILAAAEWAQVPAPNLYYWGFLLMVGGSAIFILLHIILQPEARRDLRLLVVTALLSLFLPVVFGLMSAVGGIASALYGGGAVLSLPLLPLGYFYASYRRQLGNREATVKRLISVYLFLILLALIIFPFILLGNLKPGVNYFATEAAIVSIALLSILGFPYFQTFVEQTLLSIRPAPVQLQEIYSARITTSASFAGLQNLIKDEILPSLLVRQFAFIEFDEHGASKMLFAVGLAEAEHPHESDTPDLIAASGKYRPLALLTEGQPCPWVRLVLPLKVGDKLIGLWLFGRRDPDDLYSQAEIPILQSLANQMAIAQSNLIQTERLKAFYLADIDRHELERQSLAYELHDSVLRKMAALMTNPDASLPMSFQDDYDQLTLEIRDIIGNLRPPMLSYGLELALEDLADKLTERADNALCVMAEVQAADNRYSQNVEQHVYRIVQEACENAMRHAQARNIHITGRLDSEDILITVADDGIGFRVAEDLNLDHLLVNKHFGLAGMRERAELIGAKVNIHSVPNAGTSIQIAWNSETADKK